MAQPCCPRCKQSISTNDPIAFDGNQIVHLDAETLRTTRRGLHCPSSAGNTVASWALSPVLPAIETRRRPLYDGRWNMISVRTKKITFGVLLTGLLITTTACALQAQ